MTSNTRLYGAAIAFASGLYSLWSSSMGTRMSTSAWLMLILGLVVVIHGAVLLTKYANRLSGTSGPLMIVYAVLMLLNQAVLSAEMMDSSGDMASGMGQSQMTAAMGWDAGMVALALLMLVSGLIMTRDSDTSGATNGM